MYKLSQSPHIEGIATALGDMLAENTPTDPLASVEIIVANRDTARWLLLFLAESSHIAGNIQFRLPSEWFWNLVRKKQPGLPDLLPSDIGPMSWSIFSLLMDDSVLSRLPELKTWAEKQQSSRQLRLWQLSRQISSVFDQYQVYRPEMLEEWEQACSGDSWSARKNEAGSAPAWQMNLWNLLNRKWNSPESSEKHLNRAALFRMAGRQATEIGEQPVYLFNTGLLPPPLAHLLQKTSFSRDVYDFRISSFSSSSPADRKSNHLLASFGAEQEARNHLFTDFRSRHPENVEVSARPGRKHGDHNLGLIQKSVTENQPLPGLESADGSIVVNSCHSALREVEVLHQYLTGLFSDQKESPGQPGRTIIHPDDILVMTPDPETYAPFIKAVFGTVEEGMPEIPFHIAGSRNRPGSGIQQVFSHLLQFSDSRFRKEDLFELLQHAAIRYRFQLSASDISRLMSWFDENRVIWGLDGEHRSEFGQPAEDLQTWKEALRRGWLGQLISDEPGDFHGDTLLFTAVSSSDGKELWARVQEIIGLLADLKSSSSVERNAVEWEDELNRWIDMFLPQKPSWEAELQDVRSLVRDSIREIVLGSFSEKIPFPLLRNQLIEKVDQPSKQSTFFTRGVVFNSMVPVRSLPFKVIALLGLNDDQFPRKPVHPEFDLMSRDPGTGERDRKEEDRNLFLESVMSAEMVHYCSYVGRNQKDDEPMPPSPVLDEWIQMVADHLKTEPECLVKDHSLNGFSHEQFSEKSPESFSRSYLGFSSAVSNRSGYRGLAVDTVLPADGDYAGAPLLLQNIERFFRNPAGSFFRDRLGVYLQEPDDLKEEEFVVDGLTSHLLFRHIFDWVLKGVEAGEIRKLLIQSGHLPAGWGGEEKLRDLMDAACIALQEISEVGYHPSPTSINVDIQLGSNYLKGSIHSYSDARMLDLNPSGISGKRLLSSWIRHLVLCVQTHSSVVHIDSSTFQTDLYLNFRKKKGTWRRFVYEPEAENILCDLMNVYRDGLSRPLNLYLNSAFEYASKLKQGEVRALNSAMNEWEGDFNPFPERSDAYLELFLGRDAEADVEELKKYSQKLFQPLLENMKEE